VNSEGPPSETRSAAAAALTAFALVGQLVAGKAVRDALFLSAYPIVWLPGVMLLAAAASIAAALAFARAARRFAPSRVASALLLVQALGFLAEWAAQGRWPRAAAAGLYLQLAVLGPLVLSGFWSAVSERFDPYTAKHVMGRIGTGASLGAVAGGLLSWAAAGVLPVPALLVGLAGASGIALAGLRAVGGRRAEPPLEKAETTSGLRIVREYPYLRDLAILVGLGSLTDTVLDFVLKADAAARFSGSGALMGFFGPFYTALAIVALVLQVVVTRRALGGLGLAGTVAVLPLGVAAGSAVAVVAPGLAAAALVRGASGALRDSLFRSAYELLFTPLPPWRKRPTKALVDVAADKAGAVAGAGITLAVVAAGVFPERALVLLCLAAAAGSLVLARRLHHGYVASLEEGLRAGVVEIEPDELLDSTTRLSFTRTIGGLDRQAILREIQALREPAPPNEPAPPAGGDPLLPVLADLRSGEAARIRRACRTADPGGGAQVALLLPLLARDDVFAEVLQALKRAAPRATGQIVDALLDPATDLRVRRRLPRVLKDVPSPRAVEGLLWALADPVLDVRRRAALALSQMGGEGGRLRPESVFEAVARELVGWLGEGGGEDERRLLHVFTLLSLVLDPDPLRMSLRALRGEDARLRGTALEYLENVLPDSVRRPLWPLLPAAEKARGPARPADQVEDELRRSVAGMRRPRLARKDRVKP
jgi:ATP:ADP antiporter, AAA family